MNGRRWYSEMKLEMALGEYYYWRKLESSRLVYIPLWYSNSEKTWDPDRVSEFFCQQESVSVRKQITIVLAVFSPSSENKFHGSKQQRKTRAEVRFPWEQHEFLFVLFWLFSYIYTRANRLLFGKRIWRSCASLRTIRIRIYHFATRTQSWR